MNLASNPHGWRKSRRSEKENCVEVGYLGENAAVRDSKNRAAGYLTLTPAQWSAFLIALKAGRYDG